MWNIPHFIAPRKEVKVIISHSMGQTKMVNC